MNEYYRTKLFRCSKTSETIHDQSQCVFAVIDEAKKRKTSTRGKSTNNHFKNFAYHKVSKYVF